MIILSTKNNFLNPKYILEEFKRLLYITYITNKEKSSESILMISRIFSDKDIKQAINHISLDKHRNIVTDGQSKNDMILRYLEFGGEGVPAPHIISKVKSQIERRNSLNV